VHAPIGVLDAAGLVFSCAPGVADAREAHTIVSRERVVCGEDGEPESVVRCVAVTNSNQTRDPDRDDPGPNPNPEPEPEPDPNPNSNPNPVLGVSP